MEKRKKWGKRKGKKWKGESTTSGRWRSTPSSITHCTPPSSIHTAYNRGCSTPCCMKVSCTTLSIFYTHNVCQVTLPTVLYHTLRPFHLQYSQHMACDAPHHTQTEYHAPHPAFSTHTTFGIEHITGNLSHNALWDDHACKEKEKG